MKSLVLSTVALAMATSSVLAVQAPDSQDKNPSNADTQSIGKYDTYADVMKALATSNAKVDLSKIGDGSDIRVVRVSQVGDQPNSWQELDQQLKTNSAALGQMHNDLKGNEALNTKLRSQKIDPDNVIGLRVDASGKVTVYVDDRLTTGQLAAGGGKPEKANDPAASTAENSAAVSSDSSKEKTGSDQNNLAQQDMSRVFVAPASAIAGRSLVDQDGNAIGTIGLLVIRAGSGDLIYALVDDPKQVGKFIAVPWTAIDVGGFANANGSIHLTAPASAAKDAERLTMDDLVRLTSAKMVTETYNLYGVSPIETQFGDAPILITGIGPVTTLTARAAETASQLRGSEVIGSAGKDIGNVTDVLIDPKGGKVAYVLVGSGGFLGSDEASLPIPIPALTWDAARGAYVLNQTADQIASKPTISEPARTAFIKQSDLKKLNALYDLSKAD